MAKIILRNVMTPLAALIPLVPERLQGLTQLAMNLWWSWQIDARDLFRNIDSSLWERTRHNPLELFQRVDPQRLRKLAQDPEFLSRYDAVMNRFHALERREETWFARRHQDAAQQSIAYFCAEFALHNSIPVYSGGLGVLAGDHCKEASDLGVPLVGVGLYYHKGYFDQHLRADGWQQDSDEEIVRSTTPLTQLTDKDSSPALFTLPTAGRTLHLGSWRLQVGRVSLYLLDTNMEQNEPSDRELSHKLYGGDPWLRLTQEWILGVGGVRLLRWLGVEPSVWHANEGHAAFMFMERVREHVAAGISFDEAVRRVRGSSVFTTHTPVAAGHDTFPNDDVEKMAGPLWNEMGIDRDGFMRLGRHPETDGGRFHMTVQALRLAGRVNGVSARHEIESRRIWRSLWDGREDGQVPISHVTNGVHLSTWMAKQLRIAIGEHVGADWEERQHEPGIWERIPEIDDIIIWRIHERLRGILHSYIREDARHRWRDSWRDPARLAVAGTLLSPTAFTIGFARRFATYKRADLILRDLERLRPILVDARRPVQIVFAGKAHPADDPGKGVLQKVYKAAQDPQLMGRVAFLEDYEMHLAHRLVQGVDLWLNVPRVPMEASGTSGMKAALNGVPQLGTVDGWWAEGYTGTNGWQIPLPSQGADEDSADLEHLYAILEQDVVPRFYERDARGIPVAWVQTMKHAIMTAGQRFTARRMVQDYVDRLYLPALRMDMTRDDPPVR